MTQDNCDIADLQQEAKRFSASQINWEELYPFLSG